SPHEHDEVVGLLPQRSEVPLVRKQRLRDAPDPGLDEYESEADDQHAVVHALYAHHCIQDEQSARDSQSQMERTSNPAHGGLSGMAGAAATPPLWKITRCGAGTGNSTDAER